MMNICSVSRGRPDTYTSGIEVRLWKLSKEFTDKDCKVHIIFSRSANPDSPQEQIVDGISLHGVGPKFILRFIGDLVYGNAAAKKIKEIHKTEKIDIITFHGPFALPAIFLTERQFQRPLIYYTPTALPFEATKYLFKGIKPSPYILRKLRVYCSGTLLEFMAIKYVDKVIVPSQASADELKKCYHCPTEKISVVPAGQDFSRLQRHCSQSRKSFKSSQKKLLFVGNDWHRKGVKYLLLALKKVLEKVPNVNLTITGPRQEPFISMAKELKIDDNITYAGNVHEETLAQLYAECDIFVLPSFHEGFGIPLIEAMAFGKPVITTTTVGCNGVEDGNNGFTVEPGDYQSIASSILRLLSDEKLYRKFSKNAIEKAKMFTWKKSAGKALHAYRALIGLSENNTRRI